MIKNRHGNVKIGQEFNENYMDDFVDTSDLEAMALLHETENFKLKNRYRH